MVAGVTLGSATFTSMAEAIHREHNIIPADTGCAQSPSCLACPLVTCVLDMPNSQETSLDRRQRMRDLHADGFSIRAIAALEGVSKRTVWRAL